MKFSGFLDAIPSLSPMQSCVVCWYLLQCGAWQEDKETGTNAADEMTLQPSTETIIHRHDYILFHTGYTWGYFCVSHSILFVVEFMPIFLFSEFYYIKFRTLASCEKAGSHLESNPALPLSYDNWTTTSPHNPLYVLHRVDWNASVPHLAVTQYVLSNSVRGWQEDYSLHQERTHAEQFSQSKVAGFFTFPYFCLLTSKFSLFQHEARVLSIYLYM